MATCTGCFRTFHLSCLQQDDYNTYIKNKGVNFQCAECKFRNNQMYQINQRVFGNGAATEIYQQNPYSNVQINTEQTKQNVNPIDTNQTNNNTMTSLSGTNDNFHSLLFQVLQNPKMTNEERLIFILKNNKNIRLHPYIMQVLNNRENMKKGFRYGASNYNYIKNGNNSTTKSQNGYANGGSDDSNDSKYKKKNYYNNYMTNNSYYHSQNGVSNTLLNHNIQKFPIDDVILFENPEKYEISPDTLIRPKGEPFDIPFKIFNKLVIVWDFIKTFNDSLCGEDIIQYDIPKDINEFYNELVDTKNNSELFKNILISFMCLAIKSLKILEANMNDKELYIVKKFLENPNSTSYNIFCDCICEILRVVSQCDSYRYLINEEAKSIIDEIINKYSIEIGIDSKIILLNTFVALSYETIIIKGQIKSEYEKSSAFSIEKTNLEEALKETEKRKKEITKNDKFSTLGTQIEELQKQLDEMKEKEETQELKKSKAELEMKIAKCQSILKENDNLDERKKDILLKIQKTKDKIVSLKVPRKRLLGSDYKKREYYYFNSSPGKVYIKDKTKEQWLSLSKKEDIEDLLNKLSEKGIRERKLKYYLKRVVHEIEVTEEGNKEAAEQQISEKEKEDNKKNEEETISIENNSIEESNFTINEILLKMEQKFSEYLSQFNKEWESEDNREKWKKIISTTDNEQNFISTLQMFNHRFKNPYKSDIEEEENEEDEDINYEVPEDIEKYIFIDDNKNEFIIYETDPMKVLSPKVKIWPKDIEINEVDKYYTSVLLKNITNTQKLNFALHFYEDVIFGLIKRRETKKYGHTNMMSNLLPVEIGKR